MNWYSDNQNIYTLPSEIQKFVHNAKHLSTLQELHVQMGVDQGDNVEDTLDTMQFLIEEEIQSCKETLIEIKKLRTHIPEDD